jgi:hypothetical protein
VSIREKARIDTDAVSALQHDLMQKPHAKSRRPYLTEGRTSGLQRKR